MLIIGFYARRKMLEKSLRKKIGVMEHSLVYESLESSRKTYGQIKKTYGKTPKRVQKKYHDEIIDLYKKASSFKL